MCSPACANGGTCTAPNRCSCRAGWTGSTCATGKKAYILIKSNLIICTFQLCVVLLVEMEVLALLLTDVLAEQDGLEVLVQQVNAYYVLHALY